MYNKYRILLVALFAIVSIADAYGVDYPKGHQALEIFDAEGMKAAPQWVMIWIMIMLASFAAGLLFVWRQAVARWVVGGFIAGMIALSISDQLGVIQLSGFIALIHLIFWSPALYQLLKKRPFFAERVTPFSIWSGWITAVILFSFVFDIRDTAIYLNHLF